MEQGFLHQIFNKRGITSRGYKDGGTQEKNLAQRYRGYAKRVGTKFVKTATLLELAAKNYELDAKRHDAEAELRG